MLRVDRVDLFLLFGGQADLAEIGRNPAGRVVGLPRGGSRGRGCRRLLGRRGQAKEKRGQERGRQNARAAAPNFIVILRSRNEYRAESPRTCRSLERKRLYKSGRVHASTDYENVSDVDKEERTSLN